MLGCCRLVTLFDLQGWRIEIKAYPKLTEWGSWRGQDPGDMYGGLYTQEQVSFASFMYQWNKMNDSAASLQSLYAGFW